MRYRRRRDGQPRERQERRAAEQPRAERLFGPRHERVGDAVEEPRYRQSLEHPLAELHLARGARGLFRYLAALALAAPEYRGEQHEARRAAREQRRAEYRARQPRERDRHHHRRGPAVQVGREGEHQRPPLRGPFAEPPFVERRGDEGRARLRRAEAYRERHAEHRPDARAAQERQQPLHELVGEAASQDEHPDRKPREYVEGEPQLAPQQAAPVHALPPEQKDGEIFPRRV